MYEWAKNKPEYEEEKERYRQLKSNYSEDTIEKLAFFKWSSKVCSKKLFKKIQKGIDAINSYVFKYIFSNFSIIQKIGLNLNYIKKKDKRNGM